MQKYKLKIDLLNIRTYKDCLCLVFFSKGAFVFVNNKYISLQDVASSVFPVFPGETDAILSKLNGLCSQEKYATKFIKNRVCFSCFESRTGYIILKLFLVRSRVRRLESQRHTLTLKLWSTPWGPQFRNFWKSRTFSVLDKSPSTLKTKDSIG